jgi:hypothetical protein
MNSNPSTLLNLSLDTIDHILTFLYYDGPKQFVKLRYTQYDYLIRTIEDELKKSVVDKSSRGKLGTLDVIIHKKIDYYNTTIIPTKLFHLILSKNYYLEHKSLDDSDTDYENMARNTNPEKYGYNEQYNEKNYNSFHQDITITGDGYIVKFAIHGDTPGYFDVEIITEPKITPFEESKIRFCCPKCLQLYNNNYPKSSRMSKYNDACDCVEPNKKEI